MNNRHGQINSPVGGTCGECRFGHDMGYPQMKAPDGKLVPDMSQPRAVNCCRYPPQIVLTPQGPVPLFPRLTAPSWCGEFTPKNKLIA